MKRSSDDQRERKHRTMGGIHIFRGLSTKTSKMGEIVFRSPLFEAFLFSKVHFSGIAIFILVFIAMFKKVFLDRKVCIEKHNVFIF